MKLRVRPFLGENTALIIIEECTLSPFSYSCSSLAIAV